MSTRFDKLLKLCEGEEDDVERFRDVYLQCNKEETRPLSERDIRDLSNKSLEKDNLKIFMWLTDTEKLILHQFNFTLMVVQHGGIQIVKHVVDMFDEWRPSELFSAAAKRGNAEILVFLREKFGKDEKHIVDQTQEELLKTQSSKLCGDAR